MAELYIENGQWKQFKSSGTEWKKAELTLAKGHKYF